MPQERSNRIPGIMAVARIPDPFQGREGGRATAR